MEEPRTFEISESIIFSVSEVTLHLKQVIETQIEALYVVGEISNFVRHNSGHIYFNLKDDNATIRCAFFRNQNYQLDFAPQDGDQVVCFGRISVFEKSGQYQLIVNNMFPYGKGALQQRFEQLKLKLKQEGIFDTEHKKPLPQYPESIGIITSPTGAALQDILNILERRYPCKVEVFPSLMQGNDSPQQVIRGLDYFNSAKEVDLIIITRGGGSQEDLFCFNEEQLARTIFASELPVVSAIGHEIDFTISDFVADLRAPTPSAAAELVTPNSADLLADLDSRQRSYHSALENALNRLHKSIQRYQIRIIQNNPERLWQRLQQRFDTVVTEMKQLPDVIERFKQTLTQHHKDFVHGFIFATRHLISNQKHRMEIAQINIVHNIQTRLQASKYQLTLFANSLDELSPLQVLNRGYSFVRKQGKIIKSVKSISRKDELELVLSDGTAKVTADEVDTKKVL
ncbi:MAG: exodeoxyribonuclease VII large subunit [Candidatus Cloacimonadaceae bacterium]